MNRPHQVRAIAQVVAARKQHTTMSQDSWSRARRQAGLSLTRTQVVVYPPSQGMGQPGLVRHRIGDQQDSKLDTHPHRPRGEYSIPIP